MESMSTTLTPPKPIGIDLVTVPEIAYMTRVKVATVEYWRLRHLNEDGTPTDMTLPLPDDRFGDKPVWRLERIVEWCKHTGRIADVDGWRDARAAGEFVRKTPANAGSRG